MIEYPPNPWLPSISDAYDVVIIGGGMAGLTAGFALFRQGIFNIRIFDENKEGFEGPWSTTARMEFLRSSKDFMGPALSIPGLTFHAWYRAQFGWASLGVAAEGSQRLCGQTIYGGTERYSIYQSKTNAALPPLPLTRTCCDSASKKMVCTLKSLPVSWYWQPGEVALVALRFPLSLPAFHASRYTHTGETLSSETVKDKDIILVGVGASAFDAAAYALEQGARSVAMLMRRSKPSLMTKSWYLSNLGGAYGFYNLSTELRWELFKLIRAFGSSVPLSSIDRLKKQTNVKLYPE